MGMFDYVKCDYPLPDPEAQGMSFQSKCFDCEMHEYTITKEGRLIHHDFETEMTPEDELPEENKNAEEGSIFKLWGIMRTKPGSERDVDMNYHGWFNFYEYTSDHKWYEYNAKFTDGKIVSVERVSAGDKR